MKIDVEVSIYGLWLPNDRVGYLSDWFPILQTEKGNFIPLSPGMNVFFGRNGAGKTQILEAIAHAADFKMSAYEGFILHNPQISQISYAYPEIEVNRSGHTQDKKFIFGVTPSQLLARYKAIDTEETWLGWTPGYDANVLAEKNEELVLDILQEFLSAKHALLTRSPVSNPPSSGDPERMNAPEFIQIVPMLLPTDPAPITRAHAKEIRATYLEFLEKLEGQFALADDPDLSLDENNERWMDVAAQKNKLFEAWISRWAWSPLVNVRNFGPDMVYSLEEHDEESSIFNAEKFPIFLPAAISHDNRKEYEEFSSDSESSVSLSLTKEGNLPGVPNLYKIQTKEDNLSSITFHDIGYKNRDEKSEIVDQPDLYQDKLTKYLANLKSKLKFLPNFRNLEIYKNTYQKNPQLMVRRIHRLVPVSRGSAAERRWLHLAKESLGTRTQWVVIDEPESGLHRAAEAQLANVLASSSWNQGSIIVVATHSPEFIDLPNAQVNKVEDGIVSELNTADRADLMALGLRPSDLLGTVRTILLVEGEHEKIIFENIFRSELQRAGCKIVVARGAGNMKDVFESQMIFHFSDATIVSLLDNIDSASVNAIWGEAKKIAGQGRLVEAGQFIRASLPGKDHSENTFLSQFLLLALANGQHERVEVWGLSKADIVLYFDSSEFGIEQDWKEILSLHTKSDPSLKKWASKKYGADFTVQAIDRISRSMDEIPGEFGDLMLRISELSSRSKE